MLLVPTMKPLCHDETVQLDRKYLNRSRAHTMSVGSLLPSSWSSPTQDSSFVLCALSRTLPITSPASSNARFSECSGHTIGIPIGLGFEHGAVICHVSAAHSQSTSCSDEGIVSCFDVIFANAVWLTDRRMIACPGTRHWAVQGRPRHEDGGN